MKSTCDVIKVRKSKTVDPDLLTLEPLQFPDRFLIVF